MKYLTKGELLVKLGTSANNFTAFMMNPENFGVTEPTLTMVRVAKQKLDWTNSIDLGLEEIPMLIAMLVQYGVVTQLDADNVMATPNRKDGDMYMITIKAQDVITVENIYGAVMDEGMYSVRAVFLNENTNETIEEFFRYQVMPTKEEVSNDVASKVAMLKAM